MELRSYQSSCLETIKNLFSTDISKVNKYIVMPTGTGKTEVFKRITNKKVLVLENRSDLRDQIYSRLDSDCLVIGSGKHLTQEDLNNSNTKIVVATIQTLIKDVYNINKDSFDLIVIDECHHTANDPRYKQILDVLNYKLCLGFTATPPETSTIFRSEDKLYEMTIFDAWRDNWLMKPDCYHLELSWDKEKLSKALKNKGIWTDADIEAAFISYSENNYKLILEELKILNNCEKSVVFFSTKKLADGFTKYCNERGYNCHTYTSDTKIADRKKLLQEFESKRNIILSNVYCLSEGIDLPTMECILLARPVNDVNLYKQIVGRVLRIADNKRVCKVCDCIIEQNNQLFQHTFLTAYCMPQEDFIVIDKDLYEDLTTKLNDEKNINNFTTDLSNEFKVCYELFKDEKLYCDTYDIPYFIDKEKAIIYGCGVIYFDKKYNPYTQTYQKNYDGRKQNIYFYINIKNNSLHLNRQSKPDKPNVIYCDSVEDCFKWLYNTYCKYNDNIFKSIAYTKTKGVKSITNKQKTKILELVEEGCNVSEKIAKSICDRISKKEASNIIDKLISMIEAKKLIIRDENIGE